MSLWFDGALKVSIVVLIGLLLTLIVRQRSAAVRHWLLAATIGCALAMPVLARLLPEWQLPSASLMRQAPVAPSETGIVAASAAAVIEEVAAPAAAVRSPRSATDPAAALATLWLGGSLAFLAVLLLGLSRLAMFAARARPIDDGPWVSIAREIEREYGLAQPTRLLCGTHPSLLVTWGLRPARVLIPAAAAAWSDDRIRIVLRHELAHVKRNDWLAQLAGEMLRVIYWFNPLAWIACSRLRSESEQACDDEVLRGGVSASDYATHLLEVTRALRLDAAPRVPAPAMARCSRLERRFDAMLNARVIRTPATSWFRVATGAVLLGATSLVAAAQGGSSVFSGSVKDSTGAPAPGVTVALVNPSTAARFEVKTNDRGEFSFVPLPAGQYQLEATLPGFKKAEASIALSGASVRRDVALSLGTLSETVTIRGGGSGATSSASGAAPSRRSPDPELSRAALQKDIDACEPSPTGGRVRPPRKIKDVKPIYPPSLQAAGVGGVVGIKATIGADGLVREYEVVKPVHPELDAAAVEAVKNWQFDGTLLNCAPTEVTMTVSLTFEPGK